MKLYKYFLRNLFSLVLIIAGIVHFVKPEVFMKAMPPYIPYHYELIILTGVIEIILAIGLYFKRLRSVSAYLMALYFVAIWPAHFHISMNKIPMFGIDNPIFLWGRTAFQVVLIYWALKIARRKRRTPTQER